MTQTDATRVLCIGEGMVVLRPDQPGGLVASDLLRCSVGGAEANVAGALAAMGMATTWVSRLGTDPFGEFIERDLTARGVAVLAEQDAQRPTGAYFKDITASGSRMHYYRSGSAASVMDSTLLTSSPVAEVLAGCDVVHTSGITAGILSADSDLLTHLVGARDRRRFVLSVDLNWRPALWRGRDPDRLTDLLRVADVVLLGADEAEVVFGTADATGLREVLGPRPQLVIKSDAHVATHVDPDGTVTEVPALSVEVVEPVGAGDGFAAGYVAAMLEGYDPSGRLRLGHLTAASVLAEPGDHARQLPDAETRRVLLGADEGQWAATRVTAAGIVSPGLTTSGAAR